MKETSCRRLCGGPADRDGSLNQGVGREGGREKKVEWTHQVHSGGLRD